MATPYVNPNSGAGSASPSSKPRTLLSTITSFFLFLFERITPDPYIFAVALTILTSLLAGVFAPKGTADVILTGWYNRLFNILAFAFQMVLVLVTGYALSNSPPVRGLLDRLAGIATTPKRAVVVVVLTVMVTSFVNWGCGLVVAGLLAREIAKRIKIDFGWLVAAAYSGWIIWASGLSSSIALAQATPGSVLNVVQKMTGKVLTLNETVLAPFNVVPVLVLMIVIPILYCAIQPAETETLAARPICGTGGCSATYVAGRDCHGSCHGRASRQHDPAILGLAGLSDSRDKPAASDGIYGHEFFRRANRVWAGAADVGVAGLGTSRNGLQYWSRW